MEDQLLILELQQNLSKSFSKLVELYQHLVFNTVLGMIQSNIDAEDVAQEVFVQIYQSIHQFKGDSKLSTWIYRIAISKSLDWHRKKNRKKRFAFIESLYSSDNVSIKYDPPEFTHPGVEMENKEQAAILFKAIKQLPENQKVAFTLNKVEGLSYSEIAEVMQVTIASVEAFLHRAKQNLRKELASQLVR